MNKNQQRFVEEYLKDLNASQAAIRAGYSAKGSNVTGSQLLANPSIAAAVHKAMDARAKRTGLSQDWVIKRLMSIAGANMSDLASWNTSGVDFKSSEELSDDAKVSVHQVEHVINEHGGTVRVKQHDKLKALELLGKHLGMFIEQAEVHHTLENNDYIEVESEVLMNQLHETAQ